MPNTARSFDVNYTGASMGDLFWNKVFGVIIGGVLVVLLIMELGHMLVPSHGADELTAENTAYPVDWDSLGAGATAAVEEEEAGPVDFGTLLAAANIDAGARSFRRCQACHTVDEGGAALQGPNLYDIVNRDIASVAGFNYSGALQELEGGWTFEALYGFIENPRGYAAGTSMSFAGLRNENDRIDLIAYLRSLSASPAELPAPLAAAEEVVEETAAEIVDDAAAAMDDAMDAAGDMMDDAAADAAETVEDVAEEVTEEGGEE